MPPFIYINGYPGVGKLTVAKELCKLFLNAKVVDNHLLIDPAAAVFDRTAEEYRSLRQTLRREVLTAIATGESTRGVTWIFTDSHSSSSFGTSNVMDYLDAALVRGSPFISIVLHCEYDENLKRAMGPERGKGTNTKLTDVGVLRNIREKEEIFRFNDENELELDVTHLPPTKAAARIYEHVACVLKRGSAGRDVES